MRPGKTDLRQMEHREIPEPESRGPELLFKDISPVPEYAGKLTILRCEVHVDISTLKQQVYAYLPYPFQIKVNGA